MENRNTPVHEQGGPPTVQEHSHASAPASEHAMHRHVLEDGTVIEHTHDHMDAHGHSHAHPHEHGHGHVHQNTKAVLNRLARAIGHLEKVKRMVEEGYDCSEVLIQLSAVRSALNNTGKIILKDHMEHCLVEAVQNGDMDSVEELSKAIDQFIK